MPTRPCQLCQAHPASLHIVQVAADGSRSEAHICLACQSKSGMRPDRDALDVAQILDAAPDTPGEATRARQAAVAPVEDGCPSCGMTLSQHAVDHLFGCTLDYDVFGAQVEAMVRRYHGASAHVGRLPGAAASDCRRSDLEQALKTAIVEERFEEAARLRDRLRQLAEAP